MKRRVVYAALAVAVLAGGILLWRALPGAPLGDIVYIGAGNSLCGIAAQGGAARCTGNGYADPAWQPGQERPGRIAVQGGPHDGARHLLVLRGDGRTARKLAGSGGYMRPVWSPDGVYLYALSYDLGHAVGRWDADGNGPVRIPVEGIDTPDARLQRLALSPDGKRTVLLLNRFDTAVLARLEGERIVAERTILGGFRYVPHAVWRTDVHLLFVAARNEGEFRALWEVNVDAGEPRMVGVPALALGEFLSLSPDSKSVVVNGTPAGGVLAWNLWRYDFGAGEAVRLTDGGQVWASSWH